VRSSLCVSVAVHGEWVSTAPLVRSREPLANSEFRMTNDEFGKPIAIRHSHFALRTSEVSCPSYTALPSLIVIEFVKVAATQS
jgi:hypothetical protein